jgi:hypothetical protein
MALEITGGRAGRPGFPVVATEVLRWTRHYANGAVIFGCHSHAAYRTPRVWSGHGLGLPDTEVPGFARQLHKVMNHRAYWVARAADTDRRAGDAAQWSPGRYDDEDGFVYFAGPCVHGDRLPGYHPAPIFEIALPHVRGLRIRLAAYLLR